MGKPKVKKPNEYGFTCEIVPPLPRSGEENDHFNAPELKISFDPARKSTEQSFSLLMEAAEGRKISAGIDENGLQTVRLKADFEFLESLMSHFIAPPEQVKNLQDDYQKMGIPKGPSGRGR